jgi:hypothetical protein
MEGRSKTVLEAEFMKRVRRIRSESELILIALQELANPPLIDYWVLMCEADTGETKNLNPSATELDRSERWP